MTRDQLKLTRMAKTMTYDQIGEIIGMDKSSVSRMLNGKQPIERQTSLLLKHYNEK
jgi:transcriptional regulator with XRE-family HTH domain